MKYIFLLLLPINSVLFAQNGVIKGTLKDANTGEAIIGGSVSYAPGKGAQTDIDGNFIIKIDSTGLYTLTVSYIGYEEQKQKVKVGSKPVNVNFSLQAQTLKEVEIVSDVAKTRVTPVAFSNVSMQQIQEELGTRDLPMVLNSTPGAYATEQGGGNGDARINIRGFDQRNVAVMIDGVPVNDMENGQVYWSNWDGLSDITRTMQVQRGLGASKLAIPSVGGTINILTKGIDQKMSANVKQEITSYGLNKTSFGFNSGLLNHGWGFTVAGSRKYGSEWADGTFTDAWSYFGKIQKRFKKHLFSLSASGAPQSHGQRYDRLPVGIYSKTLSDKLGINTDSIYNHHTVYTTLLQGERGLMYNPNWGTFTGPGGTSEGTISFFPKSKQGAVFNERVNYFHKPQYNLSHFWTPNEKLTASTVVYLSVGHGGGTALKNSVPKDSTNGLLSVQSTYDHNSSPSAINPTYSATEHGASNYLYSANNNHIWYGALTSWNYKVNQNLSTLFGIDARSYVGSHYQSIYNLMGADYALDFSDKNQPVGTYPHDPNLQYSLKHMGDKIGYYNKDKVDWGGAFAQAEYKKNKWSTFFTTSISETGYQRIDYFKKKDLVINGNTFAQAVGYSDAFYYNGNQNLTALSGSTVTTSGDTTFIKNPGKPKVSILNATKYTNQSAEARFSTTDKKWFLGYTFKGGANYNINDNNNVFVNLGYLNMAPRMNVVFDNNNKQFAEIKNQYVYAAEAGYGIREKSFAVNVNLYYTLWMNRPPDYTPTVTTPDGVLSFNINGMNELHKGIELDFTYKILKNLDFEGIASLADWKTISGSKVYITNALGTVVDSVDFSAKNVHTGNAAQDQFSGSLKYTIIKGLYIKPRLTYFAKNYSSFDPTTLIGTNKDRESWKMPNYAILDLYAGYDFKMYKMRLTVTAGVINLLNAVYISDAQNGAGFNATTTLVYMGMGRRATLALRIGF